MSAEPRRSRRIRGENTEFGLEEKKKRIPEGKGKRNKKEKEKEEKEEKEKEKKGGREMGLIIPSSRETGNPARFARAILVSLLFPKNDYGLNPNGWTKEEAMK